MRSLIECLDAVSARGRVPTTDNLLDERPARVVDAGIPLYPHQLAFVEDETPALALVGGVASGKTYALAAWVCLHMQREAGRWTLGAISANTYQQLEQTTLPKLWAMLELCGVEYGDGYVYGERPPRAWGNWPTRFKRHTGVLSVRDWGQAVARSLDNYDSLRGLDLGWVAVDEARDSDHAAFDVLLGRLRDPSASCFRLRLTTTPNGFDWVYDEFVEKPAGNARLSAMRKLVHATSMDNLSVAPEFFETLSASYDPLTYQQEVLGKFVSLSRGLVYHQFVRLLHVDPKIAPSLLQCWHVSFDFNRSPFSVVLAQVVEPGPNSRAGRSVEVIDEVSLDNADTTAACAEVFARIALHESAAALANPAAPLGHLPIYVHGDASGIAKSTRSNDSDYDIIAREFSARFPTRFRRAWKNANPHVVARINVVNAMLRSAVGEVRLRIHPRCKTLIRDMERVAFIPGSQQIDKTTDRRLTHASDALGYMLYDLFATQRGPGSAMITL